MSASALLLHRMLIGAAGRGWKAPVSTYGDPGPELTHTGPLGDVSPAWISSQSQTVNTDSGANPDRAESPHYLRTEDRKLSHA